MERTILEQEIRKFNPIQIYTYNEKIIEFVDKNAVLMIDKMKDLSDDEIEDLYLNLKIGYFIFDFGLDKCEKIFKSIKLKIINSYSCIDCEWSGDITECEFDTEYDEFKGIDRKYPICPLCGCGLNY